MLHSTLTPGFRILSVSRGLSSDHMFQSLETPELRPDLVWGVRSCMYAKVVAKARPPSHSPVGRGIAVGPGITDVAPGAASPQALGQGSCSRAAMSPLFRLPPRGRDPQPF